MKIREGMKLLAIVCVCALCINTAAFAQTGTGSDGVSDRMPGSERLEIGWKETDAPDSDAPDNDGQDSDGQETDNPDGDTGTGVVGGGSSHNNDAENPIPPAAENSLDGISTIPVSKEADQLKGLAVITPKNGLYEETGTAKEYKLKAYVGNVVDSKTKNALKLYAESLGATVQAAYTLDLYGINDAGEVNTVQGTMDVKVALVGDWSGKQSLLAGLGADPLSAASGIYEDEDTSPGTYTVSDLPATGTYAVLSFGEAEEADGSGEGDEPLYFWFENGKMRTSIDGKQPSTPPDGTATFS